MDCQDWTPVVLKKYKSNENKNNIKNHNLLSNDELPDKICEECKKEDESVRSNLITIGYKICDSCKISKTIFPI